jgi:hypothetical protein
MKSKLIGKLEGHSTKKHREVVPRKGPVEVVASTHGLPGRMQRRRHERG